MPDGDTLRIVMPVSLVATHFVLPLALIGWLAFTRVSTRAQLLGIAAIAVSGVITLQITQIGSSGASFYVYWLWVTGLAVALVRAVRRWERIPWYPDGAKIKPWISVSVFGVLGLLSFYYAALTVSAVASARTYVGEAKTLAFPLEGGRFIVFFGGGNQIVNLTHPQSTSSRYALDIGALGSVTLGATGATGLYPTELGAYAAYDAQIVAPCSGTVAWTIDQLPDLVPGNMAIDNRFGNQVVLHCDGDSVVLGHLRPGTIVVEDGQDVHVGDPIGRVGNSGNTMLPHLHIHVVRGIATDVSALLEWEPVPMLFEGRFLVRFDVVERR